MGIVMRNLSAPLAMIVICAGYSGAHAQDTTKICSIECLQQKIDALEHTVDGLTTQINNSIKSGQNVTLHTQAGRPDGCLTYVGPSGDKGGFVSWNVNCSRGTLWTIN
jgi:hypothetical protein